MPNILPSGGNEAATACTHQNTIIKVIKNVVTCETTALFCADCREQLTDPVTDCR